MKPCLFVKLCLLLLSDHGPAEVWSVPLSDGQVSASLVNLSLAYGALGDMKRQAPPAFMVLPKGLKKPQTGLWCMSGLVYGSFGVGRQQVYGPCTLFGRHNKVFCVWSRLTMESLRSPC